MTAVANPLRAGMRLQRTPDPCAAVVFGATGDLTSRKLIPALYNLYRQRLLPAGFSVVGFARRDWDDQQFRTAMKDAAQTFSREPLQDDVWESFARELHYVRGSFDDMAAYEELGRRLERQDETHGTAGNRLFYLATPPDAYGTIAQHLGESGLVRRGDRAWARIVVEKPFGRDLDSARKLDRQLGIVFRERYIYRIDHYLGKETVQNILVFRFGNGIFEPIWNRRYVDNVQVSVGETVGVEGRGAYYEESGGLRDMVQNHLMQVLALIAMEPVASFSGGDYVRDEKAKVFRAMRPIADVANDTVRGQYVTGAILGQPVPGYRDEPGVSPSSRVETYTALRLQIENWRWSGVPFYLRTGKRLPKRATEVVIEFKRPPLQLFAGGSSGETLVPNLLVLRIQPDEGISLRINAKVPGTRLDVRPVSMDFRYGTSFGVTPPEAYERLLLDAMLGDPTLFTRWDSVEACWELLTPVLRAWEQGITPLEFYEAGSWGPEGSTRLIERDGFEWHRM